jgi:mycofactocin radical SAM maturase
VRSTFFAPLSWLRLSTISKNPSPLRSYSKPSESTVSPHVNHTKRLHHSNRSEYSYDMAIPSTFRRYLSDGLNAPICLTWELTYGCNLSCTHCLSSSGRRDPNELTTKEAHALLDELSGLGVFYLNIGGGEPTYRRDFTEIIDHALERKIGIKFSTNGSFMTEALAQSVAATDYLDVQVSLDGHTAETNDAIRGHGSFNRALRAMSMLQGAGAQGFKVSVVVTRHSVDHLDALRDLAESYGADLRLTRLRPSGRGALTWDDLRVSAKQQRQLYDWLLSHRDVLTGDSFFHLGGFGEELDGLNLCGAGKVVCLIDPKGDVYACPFTIHPDFLAGSLRSTSFTSIWRESPLFLSLRASAGPSSCSSCSAYQSCHGGCMAAKFFNGLSFDDPDPECVMERSLDLLATTRSRPSPDLTHSTQLVLGASRRRATARTSPLQQ